MALPQTYIDVADARAAEESSAPLRVLWLVPTDFQANLAHGGNLRYVNYGRELLAQGHEVYFATLSCREVRTACDSGRFNLPTTSPSKRAEGPATTGRSELIATDVFEVEYRHPRLRGKLAHLLLHPGLAGFVLRKHQAPAVQAVKELIAAHHVDVCIVSDRNLLFVVPKINSQVRTVIDWVDSYFLYHLREARMHLKQLRIWRALRALQLMTEAFVQESYFGRRTNVNVAVSPVDRKYLEFANRSAQKNHVLANGVTASPARSLPKIKGRLIFTGTMDFPPNYESAIWFIDKVFPLLQKRWEVRLVIAGANPVPELLARANERIQVTGYVDDMQSEIARSELYVAPLVCGGGFKNKVVEAITSGTFVIGTSLASEFLPPPARDCIPTADTPEELAASILDYLDAPAQFAGNFEALRRIVAEQFSWDLRAREFVEIIRPDEFARSGS